MAQSSKTTGKVKGSKEISGKTISDAPKHVEPKTRRGRKPKAPNTKRGIFRRFFSALGNIFRRKKRK